MSFHHRHSFISVKDPQNHFLVLLYVELPSATKANCSHTVSYMDAKAKAKPSFLLTKLARGSQKAFPAVSVRRSNPSASICNGELCINSLVSAGSTISLFSLSLPEIKAVLHKAGETKALHKASDLWQLPVKLGADRSPDKPSSPRILSWASSFPLAYTPTGWTAFAHNT